LKLIVAGKTDQYPGVNGVFTKITLKLGPGSFVDTLKAFTDL